MSMIIGNATVTVVHARRGGMECNAYPTKLAAVLAMIDNGGLSGASDYYGSDGHKAALAEVEAQLAKTRTSISEMEKREARLEAEPQKPPCLQCGAMSIEEAAAKCFGATVDDCHGNRLWPAV